MLLTALYISCYKLFGLALTGNNEKKHTKNSNTDKTKKIKNSILVKNADTSKNCKGYILFLRFF